MLSDAEHYDNLRKKHVRDSEIFLSSTIQKMDWTREEEDIVMDIGCGPGSSSLELLLPFFPNLRKLIAVDVLPSMIEFAKKKYASDKIEYYVADIEHRSTLEKWEGQISKVISIFCFHWLDNQEEAFRNIYYLLKPGGQAALLFLLNSALWDSYQLHFDNTKYKRYLKDANPRVPKSHYEKLNASHYRDWLQGIGFNVIICEEESTTYPYTDDEECKAAVFSVCGLSSYIPDDLKDGFKEDLFQGLLKFSGRDTDGKSMLCYNSLTLLIEKRKA